MTLSYNYNPFSGGLDSSDDGSILPMYLISDPAINAATSQTVVNNYSGVIITITLSGNNQTIATPSITTPGKTFTAVNNDTSADSITVHSVVLEPGEAQRYIWDGTTWIAVTAVDADVIAVTPSGSITSTNVQDAIEEVDTDITNLQTSIATKQVYAKDSSGLKLTDNGSNGIFISNGGAIGINTTSISGTKFKIKAGSNDGTSDAIQVVDSSDVEILSVNSDGDIAIPATSYIYLGDATTDGSWRMGRSGDNFLHQRRESGSWVTKNTIASA